MSSDTADPSTVTTAQQQQKSMAGHLVDLLIALRWPILVAFLLFVGGVSFALVTTDLIPVVLLRTISIVMLVAFITLVWIGPMLFAGYLYVTMKTATPILIGDEDHKEVHCELVKDMDRFAFTDGLPRQRATDLGPGYIVLEAEDEPEDSDVDRVFSTPMTEKQPSWFDLIETQEYQEWRKVRVDLTKVVRESVEEKQRLYAQHIEKLRDQANRLIIGVQEDLDLSDVDELQETSWADDGLEPDSPDGVDDVIDDDIADIVLKRDDLGGFADD